MLLRSSSVADLPAWAETKFQLLCDEAGVSRNPVVQDREGWDFLLAFERPCVPAVPLDRRPGAITARVQIKSRRKGSARAELKLSNALRFCRDSDPCFIVLITCSGGPASMRIYAREFDRSLMEATLRRAREADRDGETDLHKIRMTVPFKACDDHTADLIDWMRGICIDSPETYARDKAERNRTLGSENGRLSGKVTLALSDLNAFAEHCIGLRDEAPIDRLTLHDVRFDIPARQPIFDGKPDRFRMEVVPKRAHLKFEGANGRVAIFEGEFRALDIGTLAPSHVKAAFKSNDLNGVVEEGPRFRINYNFPTNNPRSLDDLCNQISFALAARSAVTPTLWVEGAGEAPMSPLLFNVEGRFADWFDLVLHELKRVPRSGERPLLSFDDLIQSYRDVERFILSISDQEMRATVDLVGEGPPPQVRTFAYYAYIELGNSVFSLIAHRPCLEQFLEGEILNMRFGDPIILEHAARKGCLAPHLPKIRRRFLAAHKKLGKGAAQLAKGDFMQIGQAVAEIAT